MNKFSIDQLRADVARHLVDQLYFTHNIWSSAQFDSVVNFMIASLIGIDAYELMSARHSTYKYYIGYAELWIADQDTGHTIWLG